MQTYRKATSKRGCWPLAASVQPNFGQRHPLPPAPSNPRFPRRTGRSCQLMTRNTLFLPLPLTHLHSTANKNHQTGLIPKSSLSIAIWTKQPFKTLFGTFLLLKIVAMLLLLLARSNVRSWRPVAEWSLKMSIVIEIAREMLTYWTTTQSDGLPSVEGGHKKEKERHAVAEPADMSLYTGILCEKVALRFPGGAVVLAFGTEDNGQDISKVMAQHLKANKTFLAQYRISTDS